MRFPRNDVLVPALLLVVLGGGTGCRCGGDPEGPSPSATGPGASASEGSAAAAAGSGGSPAPPGGDDDQGRPPPPWRVTETTGPGLGPSLVPGALITGLVPLAVPEGASVVLDHRMGPRLALEGPLVGWVADDGDPLVATVAISRGKVRASLPPAGPTAGRPRVRVATPGSTVVLPGRGAATIEVLPRADPTRSQGEGEGEGEGGREASSGRTVVSSVTGTVTTVPVDLATAGPAGPPQELSKTGVPGGPTGQPTGEGGAAPSAVFPHPSRGDDWATRVEAALAEALGRVATERRRGEALASSHREVARDLPRATPPPTSGSTEVGKRVLKRREEARRLQRALVAHARELLVARRDLRFAFERILAQPVSEEAEPRPPEPPPGPTMEAVLRALRDDDPIRGPAGATPER